MSSMKISVIVPFYNTPLKYFEKCIKSLQELDPYEVILIDDCSDDEEVISLAKGSGFKYLKTPYQSGFDGLPLNIGVKAAAGDYICRIDSDDVLLALPKAIGTDFCFGYADRVKPPFNITVEELILGPKAVCNALVAKKEIYQKYPFAQDPNVYGDILFVLQLLYNKYTFTTYPEVNYIYTRREGSIQTSKKPFYHRMRHIQTVARFCQLENIPPADSINFLELAMKNVRHGSRALRYIKSAKFMNNHKGLK